MALRGKVFAPAAGLLAALSWTCCPVLAQQSVGTDVIVGEIPDISNNPTEAPFDAFAIGTTSCNKGNTPLLWFANDTRHPVIGQNLFRLHNGRFEQIGQAWLKHGFTALQGNICVSGFGFPCVATAGTTLGVGCSDPYSSGLNNSQGGLGPKWQVNASTGQFAYPFASPGYTGSTARRLKARTTDVTGFPGARYFVEGQYVTPDDAQSANRNNSASYREVTITGTTELTMALLSGSTTQREKPGIQAWKDVDPTVTIATADVVSDGRFILGVKVTQSGPNYTYEYALQNFNSHRSGASFTVPYPSGTVLSNVGFTDVEYHSGELNAVNPASPASDDWTSSVGASQITWAGTAYTGAPPSYTTSPTVPFLTTSFTAGTGNDHTANALRWGTLFNYRFTTTVAPATGSVQIGLFRPGTPSAISINVPTPGGATLAASTGTCCIGTACSVTTQAACTGNFGTIGATCTPDPCNVGTCCVASGGCTFTTPAGCTGGTFTSAGSCSPNPCPQPTGACCIGSNCSTLTAAACSTAGGSYTSNGSACTASICNNNDQCAAAIPLCDGSAFSGSTVGTTASSGLPTGGVCGGSGNSPDEWFSYAPAAGSGTVSVVVDTCGSGYDTVLAAFIGSCGALTSVACNDDTACNGNGTTSRITVTMTRGTQYLLRVAGYQTSTGNFTVKVTGGAGTGCQPVIPTGACCSGGSCSNSIQSSCVGVWTSGGACSPNPCPPLNDDCNNREGLGLGSLGFDTINATTDGVASTVCAFSGNDQISKDIWFNHPATFDGTLVIDTCGSTFDSKIAVYSGSGCTNFDTRMIACNDDTACTATDTLNARITLAITAGQNYTVRVGGYNNAGGLGQITLIATPTPTGSCCAGSGGCTVTTQAGCGSGSTWTAGGSCATNLCPQPTGACCRGATCSSSLAAGCSGPMSVFTVAGTACNASGNAVAPCCFADFDKSGVKDVSDIFGFLSTWFARDRMADITGNGSADPDVSDIFGFLSAWFAGCP